MPFKSFVTHLEYIRSCEELWQKGMYVELHAYQHHVFMDWRFEDDERWRDIYVALNGTGVESMSAKWDEMFGVNEDVIEEVKVKKPRKKTIAKKPVKETTKTATKKFATSKISKTKAKTSDKNLTSMKTEVKPKAVATRVVKKPMAKKSSSK